MKKIFAGFGEIMLRLNPSGKKRFAQVLPGELEACFGGGEANVCVSIAQLGGKSRYLTALPSNPITKALQGTLTAAGVDASRITWTKEGRLGIYYAEHGANMRGSNVVYDRDGSSISLLPPVAYDFDAMLEGVTNLHLTGITPSLSRNGFESTLALAEAAAAKGISISIDLNYRKKLWNWEPGTPKNELAGRCMEPIVALADLIVGNEEDASDVFGIKAEDTDIYGGKLNIAGYTSVAAALAAKFPKAKKIAITLRESFSADHNNWGGMLYDCAGKKSYFAPIAADGDYAPYEIKNIVDRFGGGDSFCAGLLFAATQSDDPQFQIRFAVAASALKHTIPGDFNYSSYDDVMALVGGNASGRVAR